MDCPLGLQARTAGQLASQAAASAAAACRMHAGIEREGVGGGPTHGNPGWTVLYKYDMASGLSGGLSNSQCTVQQDISLSGADIVTDREPAAHMPF